MNVRPSRLPPSSLLLLLSSLLFLSLPSPILSEPSIYLTFTQINDDSAGSPSVPWAPRSGATLYLHPRPLTFRNSSNPKQEITAPPYSLLVFGGEPDAPLPPLNDVWLSSDRGQRWHLIAGNTSSGKPDQAAPYPNDRSFDAFIMSTVALAPTNFNASADNGTSSILAIANIGGQYWDGHDGLSVWTSRNLLHWDWSKYDDYPAHYVKASAVINSAGVIFLIGGEQGGTGRAVADVWRSDDEGHSWSVVTTAAAFGPRYSHSSIVLSGAQSPAVDGDVILVVGGTDGSSMLNDVWASADDCVTWQRLTNAAAFSPRREFALLATPSGVLLVIGGIDASTSFNTIFASFDGGYIWYEYQWPHSAGKHSADGFPSRHQHMAAFGEDGALYVAGGRGQQGQLLNDILRSSISMFNTSILEEVFGTQVSKCGVGLYCLDDSVVVRSDGRVYCGRCASDDAISQTAFIVVVVGCVAGFAVFMAWRNFGGKKTEKPTGTGMNEQLINEDEVNGE